MGHRDRRGLRQHRRDPTTSLNDYPPTTQEPGNRSPAAPAGTPLHSKAPNPEQRDHNAEPQDAATLMKDRGSCGASMPSEEWRRRGLYQASIHSKIAEPRAEE